MQQNKATIKLLFALLVLFGCNDTKEKKKSWVNDNETNTQAKKGKPDCNCSQRDADMLAMKIVKEFTQRQNEVASEDARVMKVDRMEQRPDCSWVVNFQISYPFGNTDGWHPSEFIKKRFICDGEEIYTE